MLISPLGVLSGGTHTYFCSVYLCFQWLARFMPTERDQEQDSSSSSSFPPGFHAILEAQRNAILSAVDSQIQGLQSNLLKAQTDLASQIASEIQPENYVFKKKGNEQQFNFNRKVIRTSSYQERQYTSITGDRSIVATTSINTSL